MSRQRAPRSLSACVNCKLSKRRCQKSSPNQPCSACSARGAECISTAPQPSKSNLSRLPVKSVSRLSATPSSGDAPNNKTNDSLVIGYLAATLAYELLSHSYLQWPYPICNKIYPNLPALFEAKGRDASKIGKYAEVHVAVLIAHAARTISHSALLGPLALKTPDRLSGDLRQFGRQREAAMQNLLLRALRLCDYSGCLEEASVESVVTLLDISRILWRDHPKTGAKYFNYALQHFRAIYNNEAVDSATRHFLHKTCAQWLFVADVRLAVNLHRVPQIGETETLDLFKSLPIDPNLFISTESLQQLDAEKTSEHRELIKYAASQALDRSNALTTSKMKTATPDQIPDMLRSMMDRFQAYHKWNRLNREFAVWEVGPQEAQVEWEVIQDQVDYDTTLFLWFQTLHSQLELHQTQELRQLYNEHKPRIRGEINKISGWLNKRLKQDPPGIQGFQTTQFRALCDTFDILPLNMLVRLTTETSPYPTKSKTLEGIINAKRALGFYGARFGDDVSKMQEALRELSLSPPPNKPFNDKPSPQKTISQSQSSSPLHAPRSNSNLIPIQNAVHASSNHSHSQEPSPHHQVQHLIQHYPDAAPHSVDQSFQTSSSFDSSAPSTTAQYMTPSTYHSQPNHTSDTEQLHNPLPVMSPNIYNPAALTSQPVDNSHYPYDNHWTDSYGESYWENQSQAVEYVHPYIPSSVPTIHDPNSTPFPECQSNFVPTSTYYESLESDRPFQQQQYIQVDHTTNNYYPQQYGTYQSTPPPAISPQLSGYTSNSGIGGTPNYSFYSSQDGASSYTDGSVHFMQSNILSAPSSYDGSFYGGPSDGIQPPHILQQPFSFPNMEDDPNARNEQARIARQMVETILADIAKSAKC